MGVKEHKDPDAIETTTNPILAITLLIILATVCIYIFSRSAHRTPPGYYSVKKYCFNCYNDFMKDYKIGVKTKKPEICPKCGVADSN